MRTRTMPFVLAFAALSLAACGSTAQGRLGLGPGGPDGAGLDGTGNAPSVSQQTAGAAGLTAAQQPGGASLTGSGSGAPTSVSATGPALPSASQVVLDPSVTKPLRIGVILAAGNPGAAFGVTTPATDNAQVEREFTAIAADINTRGGFGGHRISLVFAELDRTDTGSNSQNPLQNAICTSLTEDSHVDFVVSTVDTQYANACYAAHHVPVETGNVGNAQTFKRLSPWLMPSGLSLERLARLIPLDLREQSFLTQKMAVVAFDSPDIQSVVSKILIPQLNAQGGKVVDSVYFSPTYDQLAAATASAVLRFKSEQVDRIVYFAPGGGTWLAFTRAASAQAYYPRHAISTVDEPQWTAPLIPADERPGTAGPGSLAVVDVTPSKLPPPNAREKACWAMLNMRAGSSYHAHDNNSTEASGRCEVMFLAEWGFRALQGQRWNPRLVQDSFYAIGDSYPALLFGGLGFHKGRSDSISRYAHIVWDNSSCQCMRYDSPFLQMPF